MSKPPPLTIGGKYRVIRRLGQGGMGSVYEAADEQDRRVAVKVIMTELASNTTLVGRFEREARAASAIDTPYIAKALDAGTDPQTGQPYLVMELLDGEDVDQLQHRVGALPPELALRIAAQACLALQKAHDARVLHRDIKPANLFLARQGGGRITKLLDFGVAKVRPEVSRSHAETAGLTRTGSMLGSPLYMSPEQARGYKDIDFRSDLWSIGIVLYKMLSGRAPHDDTEELGELIVLICTEPPDPIQDLAAWVAPEIAAVVHRALRFSPAERYASAEEMARAIMALLPSGHSIEERMVRGLTPEEKAFVAPRLQADLTDAPPPRKNVQTTGSGLTTIPVVIPPPRGSSPQSVPQTTPVSVSGPTGGAESSPLTGAGSPWGSVAVPPPPPPAKSLAPWVAVGVLGALIVTGIVVLQLFRLPGSGTTAGNTTGASAQAPEEKPRSVTVVILPADAKVEVDGAPATVSDGLLEITGAIGSVHRVRVVSGDSQKSVRVVVSESGAIPPKIDVKEGAAGPAPTATATVLTGAKPRPKASSSAAPTSTTADDLRNKR